MMIELNKFYCAESVEFMQECIPNNFVDLVVTSPPYDNLRTYKGFVFDYQKMIKELYRVTKDGGMVVWIVADQTVQGSETGNSFRQALFAMNCGFNLHDTMIYSKGAQGGAKGSNYCYTQSFEYMFVFSKEKPKTINLIRDRKNKYTKTGKSSMRKKDGKTIEFIAKGKEFSKRTNVWEIRGGFMVGSVDKISFDHPASFPEKLVEDHIISWSNEGDIVLDPMCGSGTTCKMAYLNNRNFIGIDMSKEYIDEICIPRLEKYGWNN